ncbi:CRTAC1 family protein [bacterium]|nr:CRTAC1 family protein [bacterium]
MYRRTILVIIWFLTISCSDVKPIEPTLPAIGLPVFEEITEQSGISTFRHNNGASANKWFPETMSGGGGFSDIDSDGDLDLVLVKGSSISDAPGASMGGIEVFENDGTGNFSRREGLGLSDLPGYGMGVYSADLDNDGDQDLVYTTLGPNAILFNENGKFVRHSNAAPGFEVEVWSTAALIFDADNDGWNDILLGNYVDWTPSTDIYCSSDGEQKGYCTPELYSGAPGVFYQNQGDGTFSNATLGSGFEKMTGKTLGISATDFNLDGLIDVIVANDTDPDQLFVNVGNGNFEEKGVVSGLAFDERGRARAGMGIDVGFADQTEMPMVVVGNFSDEMMGVYRYLGNGAFLDRAAVSGIGHESTLTLAFGVFFADFNLDGNLDIFVANGHVEESIERVRDNVTYKQPPHVFLGDGQGRFSDVSNQITPPIGSYVGRAAAFGDVNGDHIPDILLIENGGGAHIWKNKSQGNYLRVTLEGSSTNRDGLGTRVEVYSKDRRQIQIVKAGSSYLSTSEHAVTFGLGEAAMVDSVKLFWPSGQVQVLNSVEAGHYAIKEEK